MELLNHVLSITSKRALSGLLDPAPVDIAPFHTGDRLKGRFEIVEETGDPNEPTVAAGELIGGSVALTNGSGTIYATATSFAFEDNVFTFALDIDPDTFSPFLLLTTLDYISVFLEVRIKLSDGQEAVALRELVTIHEAEDEIEDDLLYALTFVDSDSIHWSVP